MDTDIAAILSEIKQLSVAAAEVVSEIDVKLNIVGERLSSLEDKLSHHMPFQGSKLTA